jgi:hypothetical protein
VRDEYTFGPQCAQRLFVSDTTCKVLFREMLYFKKETPWPLVGKQTIPTERPPLVGEVSANFCG